jgi:arsenate reductase-like glutaredoxin family protein
MAWLPWATLPARSNLTTQELIDWLRDRAIEFNAPPQFIAALDRVPDERELKSLRSKLGSTRKALADMIREQRRSRAATKEILENLHL